MTILDKRLHAFRADLADERLSGQVEAQRFVAGKAMQVAHPVVDVLSAPGTDAGVNTQFLYGASVTVFDSSDGYAWVQAQEDGYVGYVDAASLTAPGEPATHVVAAPRSFSYPEPDMKKPRRQAFSMGSKLTVTGQAETRGTHYALLSTGDAVVESHLRPVADHASDWVALAETLEHTPYLWGGTSGFGIDCSGLIQLAMRMAGRSALRDSDMQAAALGEPVEPGPNLSGLRRGDLVFWKGHVAIMTDAENIIHANGHTMMVSREPLAQAVARIRYLYGQPTGYRRP